MVLSGKWEQLRGARRMWCVIFTRISVAALQTRSWIFCLLRAQVCPVSSTADAWTGSGQLHGSFPSASACCSEGASLACAERQC